MADAVGPPHTPTADKRLGGGGDGDDDGGVVIPTPEIIEDGELAPTIKRRIDFLHGTQGRSQLPATYEFSFSPSSMVGSWFHRLENDEIVWQGVVVGEPQPGTYLVQIERLEFGVENAQRLIALETMLNDDDGYDWRFYDNREAALTAFQNWIAARRTK
jgi:hypothetical protein